MCGGDVFVLHVRGCDVIVLHVLQRHWICMWGKALI